jgi:quercetin dioxygenase-like cupin family protein
MDGFPGSLACAALLAIVWSMPSRAEPSPSAVVLLETGLTVAGEPIVYPTDAPARISTAIVTVPPGATTGWHRHGAPMVGYLLEGELDVEYADGRRATVRAGDAIVEALYLPHVGTNRGSTPARVLTVLIGTTASVRTIPMAPGTEGH